MLILGLGLVACGDKSADSADTSTTDTADVPLEPADAPEYGVEAVENADEDIVIDFDEFDSKSTPKSNH